MCGIIKDELNSLVGCRSYAWERQELFEKISNLFPQFQHMDNTDKFVFMLCYPDPNLLTAFGKFIHTCFQLRNSWQWFHFFIPIFLFYYLSVIMGVIIDFIISVLSWVLLYLSSYHIVMVKHSFWYLERKALLCTPMGSWDTSDVLEGIGVGFRDASGNPHPTYMFTLCFMCFNCIFTYLIYYVPVFYLHILISRQRLQ